LNRFIKIWIFSLLLATVGFAAEVLEIGKNPRQLAITQSHDTRSFVPRDYLCVWHGDEEIACGVVIEVQTNGAILRLDYAKETVRKGDRVFFAGSRHPAFTSRAEESVIEAVEPARYKKKYPFDITGGMLLSQAYTHPLIHFQGQVATHWAVGLAAQFVSANSPVASAKGQGGMLTVNYYGSRYFRGLWLQGAGGLFFLKPYSDGSLVTLPSGLATVGARLGIYKRLNFGIGVGAQYIQSPNGGLNFTYSPWQAIGMADLGFQF